MAMLKLSWAIIPSATYPLHPCYIAVSEIVAMNILGIIHHLEFQLHRILILHVLHAVYGKCEFIES